MQNPSIAAPLHVMPPKQSQVQGMPPVNSSSGSWFGASSVRQSQAVQSYPDGYSMCPGANGNIRHPVFYEGRSVHQKIPHGHVQDYGRPGMIPSQVLPNGFLANGLSQRNFSPDDNMMMMDSSISHQLASPGDQHMMQMNNPSGDLYPDPRTRGSWRTVYPPQYDPVPGMQDPAMGPLEGARPPASMGPGLLMAPSDMNQDMMVCRMSGEPGIRGSSLLAAQHPSAYFGPQQRVSPYPNPQQYMQNKRAQYSARRTSHEADINNGWFANGGCWPRNPYPQQVLQGYPYADGPCHAKDGGPGPYPPGAPARNHCQTERWQLSQTSREPVQCNNAFSPPPGNPTPPMTPGSTSMPPCHLPVEQLEVRSGSQRSLREHEPYFTFAVREGMIKLPFQLEHNLPVSCHIFNLHDQVHESLMSRSDFELMLKCFHKEDRSMTTNWPSTVAISLNEVPLLIERGNALVPRHQPMFLKSICKPGQNTLQISVKTCCCSHLFILQIVHRPSVRSVLHGLVSKRLLPAQHSVSKIKRVVSQHVTSMTSDGLSNEQQQPYLLPLTCPISRQRIHLPSRGQDCRHIECFDLESYLKVNCEQNHWMCPICKKMADLDGLEVDQYVWGILVHLSNTCFDTIVFDASGTWKPVPKSGVDCGNDANLCKKFISVNSMVLPSPSTHLTCRSSLSGSLPPSGCQVNISKEAMGTHKEHRQRFGGPGDAAPDYLGRLSHMTDVFLGSDHPSSSHNAPHSTNSNIGLEHVSFPPTPVGSQISTICTPLDGQSLHPHTPPDGHPFTPVDSQSSKPSPENCGSAGGTPRTPSTACGDSLGGGGGRQAAGVVDGGSGAGQDGGVKREGPDQSQPCGAAVQNGSTSRTENSTPGFSGSLGMESLFDPNEDGVGIFSLVSDVFNDEPSDLTSYLGPNHNNTSARSSTLVPNSKGVDSDDDFLSFLS